MTNKRLYSPKYIKEILKKYNFSFSKSLGQNFLIDGNIVRGIVQGSKIGKDDYCLEIGPGFGTLTEELSLNCKKLVAVELDKSLKPVLEDTLKDRDNVNIIFEDILKVDLNKLIEEKLAGGPIKVVANLPYYVTTPIIGRLLEENLNIDTITVMVQKEVADRIVAKPGSKQYGALTLFIDFYTTSEIILNVPKTVFMPQPKIDSAVVKLKVKKDLPHVDKDIFSKVVKSTFMKRRKTILNGLSTGELNLSKETIRKVLEECKIPPGERGENLSLEDFINISKTITPCI